MSTEICTKLFTRRRIERRDRRRSFSISLNFYQTILESSLQTRFMFDIKKLSLIDALTFIPGETQDDPLRIAIDLPKFRRIPQACHSTDLQRCVTPQLSLLLFRFVAFHYDIKLIYCGFFFLEGFSAKQQKTPKKKKSLQRYRALSDNYMENKMFVSKNDGSK